MQVAKLLQPRGSLEVEVKAAANPLLLSSAIDSDLRMVIARCLLRYKTEVESLEDWLYIFEEEMSEQMKRWGTWQPLQQMKLIEADGSWRYIDMWRDPNFYDEYNRCSMGTEGFGCKFKLPDGREVKARYFAATNNLEIE